MNLPRLASELATGFSAFGGAIRLLEAEWAPEEPPITLSMSELGRALVEGAGDDFSPEAVAEIFHRVERVLISGSDADKDAVATGFLEAVATALDRRPERRWVLNYSGPAALKYLEAWDQFCGVS